MYKIRIIPVSENSIKAGHPPKYTLMVRKEGESQWLKQTPELIEDLNKSLETALIAEYCMECNKNIAWSENGLCDQCSK